MNKKRIKLLTQLLEERIIKNPQGGTINISGCLNRYIVGAKELTVCHYKYFEQDSAYYIREQVIKALEQNYIDNPKKIDYDSIGWWTIEQENKMSHNIKWLYIDLGFRFSDKFDALKFAQHNGEIAIYDTKENKEIFVNK